MVYLCMFNGTGLNQMASSRYNVN